MGSASPISWQCADLQKVNLLFSPLFDSFFENQVWAKNVGVATSKSSSGWVNPAKYDELHNVVNECSERNIIAIGMTVG